jgi:dTDP-4-amino-4,6-dideoxygalactose transaminase
MIPVTKPYLPSRKKLERLIDGIYERHWFANNGQLVQELTHRLEEYLGVENLLLVANGTLALQVAYRVLGLRELDEISGGEAVTAPVSFVATASSLRWEGVKPVFADIDPSTWCLSPSAVNLALSQETRAIVPVHVYGNACNVEEIDAIAKKRNLSVIYDASHAFGVKHNGESLLKHGDAATLSFHATKLFHTGEGGAIVFRRKKDLELARKVINFGITGPDKIDGLGINAKMSELQAALGLCVLDEIDDNLNKREAIWNKYKKELSSHVQLQELRESLEYNYAYFPALFDSEKQAVRVAKKLEENGIQSRRYFYPSLDLIDVFRSNSFCPTSNDIASRILCLPMFNELRWFDQRKIIELVKGELGALSFS